MFRKSARGRTTILVLLLDAACPVVVVLWHGFLRHDRAWEPFLMQPWLLLMGIAFPLTLAVAELYSPRGAWCSSGTAWRVLAATVPVVGLFGLSYALAGDRGETPALFGALTAAMLLEAFGARAVVGCRLRGERDVRRALVVGAGWAGRAVIDCTLFEPRLRVRVAGVIDDDPLKRNVQYKGVPVVGTGQDLPEAVARLGVDLVIDAITHAESAALLRNLCRLRLQGVEVFDMPGFVEQVTGQVSIRRVDGKWLLCGGGFDQFGHRWRHRLKRTFDVAGAAAGLLLALPLMAGIAALIRAGSRGPVFVVSERIGLREAPVRLLRFRSLRETPGSAAASSGATPRQYRLTGIGRWLRRTRLDEIPLLFNVLTGALSFVGPRPETPPAVERLKQEIPYYALRFSVRPGLAGWAQVQHRPGTSTDGTLDRLRFDLYYVKNLSFRLDLFVILKALKLVFFPAGR